MSYPKFPDFKKLGERLSHYAELKYEYGANGIDEIIQAVENKMKQGIQSMRNLPENTAYSLREPDTLRAIQAARPGSRRVPAMKLPEGEYKERLGGALLARCAGCTLGAPVELWSIEQMENLAKELDEPFPPTDYWLRVPDPFTLRYQTCPRKDYTRPLMDGVPVDDDITYTMIGLLIAEKYGLGFSTSDVGEAWLKWLPHGMTAEGVALENLRNGLPAREAGAEDNPYSNWIGADIRADPWGYLAPGKPEMAAAMAYQDAYLSHRRQGIYGSMYFAAAIAAAFVVNDPIEALQIGLTEIPKDSALASAIQWALNAAPDIKNYRDARLAVDEKFSGMHPVHTINNACLTIFGLTIGGTDVTRVIGETVAMGLDNDCTAATAGSIVGAIIGQKNIPLHWTAPFKSTIHTYLNDHRQFDIPEVIERFSKIRAK